MVFKKPPYLEDAAVTAGVGFAAAGLVAEVDGAAAVAPVVNGAVLTLVAGAGVNAVGDAVPHASRMNAEITRSRTGMNVFFMMIASFSNSEWANINDRNLSCLFWCKKY
jgi:hypothetical protein